MLTSPSKPFFLFALDYIFMTKCQRPDLPIVRAGPSHFFLLFFFSSHYSHFVYFSIIFLGVIGCNVFAAYCLAATFLHCFIHRCLNGFECFLNVYLFSFFYLFYYILYSFIALFSFTDLFVFPLIYFCILEIWFKFPSIDFFMGCLRKVCVHPSQQA